MCDSACRRSAYARAPELTASIQAGSSSSGPVRTTASPSDGNPCSGYNNAYAISAEPKRKRRVLSDRTRTVHWIASLLNPGRASDLLARHRKAVQQQPGRTGRCRGLETDRGCRLSDVVLRMVDR